MNAVKLENLSKRFGATTALDRVSLDFPTGSFTALLGPSGCGKTTMLRLIAGFEAPSEGQVLFGETTMADPRRQVPPEARNVGVVFQSYALWPHLDVSGNVAYPLQARGTQKADIAPRVASTLEGVGLSGFGTRRIDELSGGQRQRVALARCLVADSRLILFDEPLANLDIHLRAAMVDAFRDIHRRTGATIAYVTHDQSEALALADRVAVMNDGRLLQVAPPADIYRMPANAAVAAFVGRGSIVSGMIVDGTEETVTVDVAGHRITARAMPAGRAGPARVLLRPEGLRLAAEGLPATVLDTIYRGPVYETRLALGETGEELLIDSPERLKVGETVRVSVSDAWLIPAN